MTDETPIAAETAEAGSDDAAPATEESGARADWVRYLPYAVYGMFALRVIVVLVMARNWFFTDDDWDYITRESWGDVLGPHAGHLNVVTAAWAFAVRGIVGLDYWPGYALLAALTWPLVGLAAWHVWRRLGTDPRWAAFGAILLFWLGTASWIQFGHAGQGVAAAAVIVAVYLDGKPVKPVHLIPNILFSLLAVFSSSTAGLAVIVRAGLGLLYRKWNAVIAAGFVGALYILSRFVFSSLGPGTLRVGLKGLTDVFGTIRVGLEVIGVGARDLLPWPRSLAWILGAAVVGLALFVLWRARFSYFATALIGSAAFYIAISLVSRFLGRARKLEEVTGGDWGSLTAPRFANLAIAFTIVAFIPLLASARFRSRLVPGALVGAMVVVLGWGVVRSVSVWDQIADKSADPKASWVAPLVELRMAGEPGHPTGWRKIYPTLSTFFTLDSIDYIIDAGLAESLLASDIYRSGTVPEIGEVKARGRLRMNIRPDDRTTGSWGDLGKIREPGCVLIEESRSYRVQEAARFRLERVDGNDVTLRYVDAWGRGTAVVSE